MANKVLVDCERMKYPYTGLYQYCLQIGNALLKQELPDEDVGFYVPKSAENVFGEAVDYLPQRPLHKYFFPKLENVKVWHCTYQNSRYYPHQTKVPVVLTIHDLNFLYEDGKSKGDVKRYLKELQVKVDKADEIVAISSFVLNDIGNHLDISKKSASVIYNGCRMEEGVSVPGLASDLKEPFLFTIGTIAAKKNFHVLPPLLVRNNFKLVIAGTEQEPFYKQKIINEAKKWGVSDRVIFTGPIPEGEKRWYLSHCAAFLFPSIAEGFGLPVIEAMHFGRPVILSTHTSLPEIGGTSAYYFHNFDPDHMRQTLADSLGDFERRQPMEEIRKRAAEFSWESAASKYLEIYRGLY